MLFNGDDGEQCITEGEINQGKPNEQTKKQQQNQAINILHWLCRSSKKFKRA